MNTEKPKAKRSGKTKKMALRQELQRHTANHPLSDRQCVRVPVEAGDKTIGGRKSRRVRKFKWVSG